MAGNIGTSSDASSELPTSSETRLLPGVERVLALSTASQYTFKPSFRDIGKLKAFMRALPHSTVSGGHASLMRYDIGEGRRFPFSVLAILELAARSVSPTEWRNQVAEIFQTWPENFHQAIIQQTVIGQLICEVLANSEFEEIVQQPPYAGNDLWPVVTMIAMYCLSRSLDGSEVLGSEYRLKRILQMLRSSIEEDGEVTGSWPDEDNKQSDRNGKFLELPKYREDMYGVWTAHLYREPTADRREPVVVVNISPDFTGYSCIAYPDWEADSFEVITGPVDRSTRSSVPSCTEIQPSFQHTVRVQMPDADTAAYGSRMRLLDVKCDDAEFSKMSQVLQLAESQEQGPQNGNPELATSQPAAPVAPISSQMPVTTAQHPAAQLPEPQYGSAPAGNMPGPFHSAYNIAPIQPVHSVPLFAPSLPSAQPYINAQAAAAQNPFVSYGSLQQMPAFIQPVLS